MRLPNASPLCEQVHASKLSCTSEYWYIPLSLNFFNHDMSELAPAHSSNSSAVHGHTCHTSCWLYCLCCTLRLSSLLALVTYLLPSLVQLAGQVALMCKVTLVLLVELAVLPVVYGFWLDICALPLLGGSVTSRVHLLQLAPVSWTILHWVLGMCCLVTTAAFISLARSLLRPG